MMSHPVQGWMVNALGHAVGGRNFDTPDDSRNNTVVSWLVSGEYPHVSTPTEPGREF